MSSPAYALNEIEDLYNNAPCGFLTPWTRMASSSRVNDTELRWLGYERDELIGKKKITDLLAPECIKPFKDAFPDFILHGYLRDLKVHLLRKDGSILPVLVSANAIRDSQGNYVMTARSFTTSLSVSGWTTPCVPARSVFGLPSRTRRLWFSIRIMSCATPGSTRLSWPGLHKAM